MRDWLLRDGYGVADNSCLHPDPASRCFRDSPTPGGNLLGGSSHAFSVTLFQSRIIRHALPVTLHLARERSMNPSRFGICTCGNVVGFISAFSAMMPFR